MVVTTFCVRVIFTGDSNLLVLHGDGVLLHSRAPAARSAKKDEGDKVINSINQN